MSTFTKTLGAATVGGFLVYFLDPKMGKKRRNTVKDRSLSLLKRADRAIGKTSRDLGNRTRGAVAEARSLITPRGLSDEVLVEQLRARIGRVVSFPHLVEISSRDAAITLQGSVLASELDDLLNAVSSVRNVSSVRDELKTCRTPQDIPGMHAEKQELASRRGGFAAGWAPAIRVLMGAAGSALLILGRGRRGRVARSVRFVGLGLVARAITNMRLKELLGVGPGRGIHVQKSINIGAPVERVFHFLSNYQNLPQFLSHLREIRRSGNYSHWVAAGPLGPSLEWDARITNYEPNKLLAWKSLPGSTIRTAGTLRFQRLPASSTRLDLNLSYNPPAGGLGHALASLFGSNPKQALDTDLNRLKTLFEAGKLPANRGALVSGFSQGAEQGWQHAT